ncbi:MAG TPA: hypothetical protein VFK80_10750, partial [Limnochordia bacterium]|nr:hypothetical protein [Limnochordia bacterium]
MTQRRILHAKSPIDLQRTLRRELQKGAADFLVTASGEIGLLTATCEGGVLARIRPAENGGPSTTIVVEVEGPPEAADAAAESVRRVFALEFDLAPLYAALGDDPLIGPLLRRYPGLRMVQAPNLFGCLIETIIAQQINRTFARTLNHRLIDLCGRPIAIDGRTVRLFPTPDALARLDAPALRALQFSERKAQYVIDCARAVAEGRLDL